MSEPQRLIHIKAALQQQRQPLYEKIIKWTWRVLIGGIAAVTILFLGINFSAIPSFRELEDPASAVASEVLANNNEVLGRYFIENRVPVTYEELSPHLVNALISTEDVRFREHCGIDARAVGRVIFRTLLMADQSSGGGSTITQQLAKMLYSDRDFSGLNPLQKTLKLIYMKLREWITAVKLERSYTKEEIISMYLNQFNFINNAYGIHAASEVYFSKKPNNLLVQEAATLIGMLQNPSYFNPNRYPDRCFRRRWIVLGQMRNNNILTEQQYDSLKVSKFDMTRFKKVTFSDDRAPYLCSELKKDIGKILEQPECRRSDGTKYDLYKDGLKVYTTIDPAYQQHAEAAMREHMKKQQSRFFAVWKGRDPWKYKTSETTPQEIEIRQEELWKLVREGERYQAIRPRYFDNIDLKTEEKYKIKLRDVDVDRMLDEEKTSGSISKLVGKKYISSDQAATYRRILSNSADWTEIKSQYRTLRAIIKKQYDTKVKMTVFTWNNDRFEKDTIMSPMDSLRYHRMFLQTGMLAVDPTTSEIKAWVGGINFKYFQYDHIRNDRQVGSTFKPFVYAAAIAQQSISPCLQVYDQPTTIEAGYRNFTTLQDWTPKNSTGTYSGSAMSLKDALKNSVNSISAYLMKQMGDTELVRGLCNNMGIDSAARRADGMNRVPKVPSICLGAADLKVLEMTGAYATFANKGMYSQPFVIRKIEDRNGRVIYRSLPEEKMAVPQNANWVMLEMLRYNVQGAPGINTLKSDVGGKTGTTNDYTDGWFMGVTPRLVVGTWVGGEDRWIRFLNLNDGQGAKMARPIFASFIGRLEKDPKSGYDYNARFVRPAGDLGIETDCSKYANAAANNAPTDEESFGGPDIYGDELEDQEEQQKSPKKKPDAGFGDDDDG